MATTPPHNSADTQAPLVSWLLRHRQPTAIVLLAIGALLLVGGIVLRASDRALEKLQVAQVAGLPTPQALPEQKPETPATPTPNRWPGYAAAAALWLIGLLCLAAGVLPLIGLPEVFDRPDAVRVQVLILGGVVGLVLACLGLDLGYVYFKDLVAWLQHSDKEHLWRAVLALVVLLAGLGVMFATLQGFRTEERDNATMRRLLYGYNTFLSMFLLLLILISVNTAYALSTSDSGGEGFKGMVDVTQGGFYSLEQQSTQVLEALDRPVKVYLIMVPNAGRRYTDIDHLMKLCQSVTEKFQVVYLSPETSMETLAKLRQQYRGVSGDLESEGMLVTLGDNASQATFLPIQDMFAPAPQGPGLNFSGESKLINAVRDLSEGGRRATVYFLQGQGEADLEDTQSPEGMGLLKQRLAKRAGLTIKPLTLDPLKPVVPNDCSVLAIVGPKAPYSPAQLAAISSYLEPTTPEQRKARQDATGSDHGKLLVYFNVAPNPTNHAEMLQTGLEPILSRYNVTVTNSRLLTLTRQRMIGGRPFAPVPEMTLAGLSPGQQDSTNPLARMLADLLIPVSNPRLLRAGGQSPQYRAEPLLSTPGGMLITWPESNLAIDSTRADEAIRDAWKKDNQELLHQKNVSVSAQPLFVVVSEQAGRATPFQPAPAGKPRLAIYGSTSFVLNRYLMTGAQDTFFDLAASTVDWLREKPVGIGVTPKTYKAYALNDKVSYSRLLFLPLGILTLAVVGLGAGVWVVRRR